MVIYMRGSGKKIKKMDKVFIRIVLLMKNMKVNGKKGLRRGAENSYFKMAIIIKENL